MTDMTVANTILSQLGGRRFQVMTGTHSFVGGADYLSFFLSDDNGNKRRAKCVRVTLNGNDTYTMELLAIRNLNLVTLKSEAGLYADMLADTFTEFTGLLTHL